MTITLQGSDEFQARLAKLRQAETAIEFAGVRAGCAVMARAGRDAVPGRIKREVGMRVRVVGSRVEGRAGLVRFPRKGDGPDGPHGVYSELGTKFIAPRYRIRAAQRSARAAAIAAMRRAVKGKIRALTASQ